MGLEAEDLDSPVSALAWSDDGEAFALGSPSSTFSHLHHSCKIPNEPEISYLNSGHDDGKVSLWTSAGALITIIIFAQMTSPSLIAIIVIVIIMMIMIKMKESTHSPGGRMRLL